MNHQMIERADDADVWLKQKGVWKGAVRDGERTANLSCPRCGQVASLSGHTINAEGAVDPSVVCPSCDFHEYVTLIGWEPKEES